MWLKIEICHSHVIYHFKANLILLLCKSHPALAFDRSNLEVLASIKKELKFRENLQSKNPAVILFLWRKTSVVECGIDSILSLIVTISQQLFQTKLT